MSGALNRSSARNRARVAAMAADHPVPRLELSSLVDVAFLLLTFFLLTSTLAPKEADLEFDFTLPVIGSPIKNEFIPEITRVAIDADGIVWCDEVALDADVNRRDLPNLLARLMEVKQANAISRKGNSNIVSIKAADEVSGQRLIDVMNCLAQAGIEEVELEDFLD